MVFVLEGNWVKVERRGMMYEGTVMPSYDKSLLILKLKNGYNVGFKVSEVRVIESRASEGRELESPEEEIDGWDVSILGTGGTIASYVDYATGAVYPAKSTSDLLRYIPEISDIARVRATVLFSTFSENMGVKDWVELAEKVKGELDDGAKGVVITHGTDTMGYTASALSFMLPELGGPVVLTGSQRSTDRPSSDGFLNLLYSTKTALTDLGEVVVAMHEGSSDERVAIHRGTRVRKMHTSARGAFRSMGCSPLGFVDHGAVQLRDHRRSGGKTVMDTGMNERVSLLHFYPGMSERIFDAVVDGNDGIVIAGTGLGHVSEKLISGVGVAISEGKMVVMCSQCLSGRVNMNVYSTGRKLLRVGVIPCEDMLPETAYVKLMWVLGHTEDAEKARELMLTNLSGEINERRTCAY